MSIERFKKDVICVVGDIILLHDQYGTVTGLVEGSHTPKLTMGHETWRLGGAANLALNLKMLGCPVRLVGVIGQDEHGRTLRTLLEQAKIDYALEEMPGHATLLQQRIFDQERLVLAMGTKVAFDEEITKRAFKLQQKHLKGADALIIADHQHGSMHPQSWIILARQLKKRIYVQPSEPRFASYRGSGCMVLSWDMFRQLLQVEHMSDVEIVPRATAAMKHNNIAAMIIAHHDGGMHCLQLGHAPVFISEASSDLGADHVVMATLAAFHGAGCTLSDAAVKANEAASLVEGRKTPIHLMPIDVVALERGSALYWQAHALKAMVQALQKQGQCVTFVHGLFDPLSAEDIIFLESAKSKSDYLVVVPYADEQHATALSLEDRCRILSALRVVDALCPMAFSSLSALLQAIQPDIVLSRDKEKADIQ